MADDAELREAARARGFRLVKSRRRKPGGDFGRYGLVGLDSGRECLGFGQDGLTATSEEVLTYLRGGEVASWKRSLIGLVGEGRADKAAKDPPPAPAAPAPRRGEARGKAPAKVREPARAKEPGTAPALSPKPRTKAATAQQPPPPPPRELTIREATRRDAAALAKLLGIPAGTLSERLAALRDDPPLVAEFEAIVGIVAWAPLPTLQHGTRARITLLFVAETERRRGVGTRLIEEAEQRLRDAGIEQVELALDIDLDAPAAFLRRTGWERTTNGYGKAADPNQN